MTKKVNCREAGYDCDFEIQSEGEDEVIEFTRQHAKEEHGMELSRSDAKGLLQDV